MDNFFIDENIEDTKVSLFAIFHNHGTSDVSKQLGRMFLVLSSSKSNTMVFSIRTKKNRNIRELIIMNYFSFQQNTRLMSS